MIPAHFPVLPEDWLSESFVLRSSDQKYKLYSQLWRQKNWTNPRTVIVCHGLGEHGGRYLHFTHYLQKEVGAVFYCDHRGHGKSEGLRGHVKRFDDLIDDLVMAIEWLKERLSRQFQSPEIHLVGHSLGGLITLRTLLLNPALPLASISVSASALGLAQVQLGSLYFKKMFASALSYFWGSLHLQSQLNARLLSHDAEVVLTYQRDRLVHQKITPQFFIEFLGAIKNTWQRVREISPHYAIQFLVPMQDQIVHPKRQQDFFNALMAKDKEIKLYVSDYHELFNELDKEIIFLDLAKWIQLHSR